MQSVLPSAFDDTGSVLIARPVDPPDAPPAGPADPWTVLGELVHDRRRFIARVHGQRDLARMARTLLLCTLFCCAGYGAALGLYRGGLQVLYAAVKVPLVVLLTATLCGPFLVGLRMAFAGRQRSGATGDLLAILSGMALGSLVLAALLPVMISLIALGASYHTTALALAGSSGVAATAGSWLFLKTLRATGRDLAAIGTFAVVAALVIVQMGWTFRPYLVRPRSPDVVFMRSADEALGPLDAVIHSFDSARGFYKRPEAPLPEARP